MKLLEGKFIALLKVGFHEFFVELYNLIYNFSMGGVNGRKVWCLIRWLEETIRYSLSLLCR